MVGRRLVRRRRRNMVEFVGFGVGEVVDEAVEVRAVEQKVVVGSGCRGESEGRGGGGQFLMRKENGVQERWRRRIRIRIRVGVHFFEKVAVAVRTDESGGRGGEERDAHVTVVTPVCLTLHDGGGGGGGGGGSGGHGARYFYFFLLL
ncbi:unnamed protein product [Ilex paraguariensis]|uniref:Uncharacterized protein n=1 Tax=Ilex paraguariensis TaxID=185542 RepID=A0ABC8UAX1_9AQUA